MPVGSDRQPRSEVLGEVAEDAGVGRGVEELLLEVTEGDVVERISAGLIWPMGHEVVLHTLLLR
jgi:hypothetical protein